MIYLKSSERTLKPSKTNKCHTAAGGAAAAGAAAGAAAAAGGAAAAAGAAAPSCHVSYNRFIFAIFLFLSLSLNIDRLVRTYT